MYTLSLMENQYQHNVQRVNVFLYFCLKFEYALGIKYKSCRVFVLEGKSGCVRDSIFGYPQRGTIVGYRGRAIAAVHSIVLRDTVTSLPVWSVTRGISAT